MLENVSYETKRRGIAVLEIINLYMPYAVAGFVCLNIILIIVVMVQTQKIKKLQRRFERFMSPASKKHNIEGMLLENIKLVKQVEETNRRLKVENEELSKKLKNCIQYMGIVRYNTFEDVGGDFSYAIALMDEDRNGVVLNSLYYREGCYTYAKPIAGGACEYLLSPEEQQAIDKAIENSAAPDKTVKNEGEKKATYARIRFKERKDDKNKADKSKGDKIIVNNSKRSNEVAGA